jgi:hypothetical protein
MMNPFELNKQAAGEAAVYNPTIDLKGDYYQNFITRSKSLGAPVMAINPSRATPRQASQRSVFTLHNDIWSPLEATYPEQLIRVDIPITCIPEAKEFLQLAGINEYTLFPDFDGLARHLHQEHAKHFWVALMPNPSVNLTRNSVPHWRGEARYAHSAPPRQRVTLSHSGYLKR